MSHTYCGLTLALQRFVTHYVNATGANTFNHLVAGKGHRACIACACESNASRSYALAVRNAITIVLPSFVGLNAHKASLPNALAIFCTLLAKLELRPNKLTVIQPLSVNSCLQSA